MKAIEECYIKELPEGYSEYDNGSLFELIERVKNKYVILDDCVLENIMAVFAGPPDLSMPINVYYAKQEECQRQGEASDDPVKDGDMVRMLQKHMGDSGTLIKKEIKFDKKDKADRTWKNGKELCREALEDLKKEAKRAGAREFLANSAVASKDRAATEEEVLNAMATKMGESFDALAMAVEALKATYEEQARIVSTLTATSAELTATIKKLADKIVTLSEKLAAAAKLSGRGGSVPPGFDSDSNKTGSAANLDGVFMPTRKNKKGLECPVSKQQCNHCGKAVRHLPEFCLEKPQRKIAIEEAALVKAKEDAGK